MEPAIHRAPMRARSVDAPPGAGARFGLAAGVVGIGEPLASPPLSLDDAVEATAAEHGAKAARMLRRFAHLPDGAFVWTRDADGLFWLGRVDGPWGYDGTPAALGVGIPNVRPATWLDRPFGGDEVPAAVAATFARGGRNLQRTHDRGAERRTAELWAGGAPAPPARGAPATA
jgi:hypothetical protein